MTDPTASQPTPDPAPTPPPAPAQPPAAAPAPAPAQDPPPTPGTDWKAEARKWEKLAKTNSDAATKLQELEDAKKTDEQKLADELQKLKAEGATSKTQLLRLEVALDKAPDDMPKAKVVSLAKRLTGSTKEELEADAKELFADFGGQTPEPGEDPPPNGQPPGGQPKPDPAQGSRGNPPAGRPNSLGQAVSAALTKPKT